MKESGRNLRDAPAGGVMAEKLEGRIQLVEEHVEAENAHDLDGIMTTFGEQACYEDQPWDEHYDGPGGVRAYYTRLLAALPDLHIGVERRHVTHDHVILEVTITGTHRGTWRGLPATGRRVRIPLCAVYTFDDAGKLREERIYYDRAAILAQIGLFHEPSTALGRSLTALTHPVTVLGAYASAAIRRMRNTRAML
jgi:steroid delta-isomerase-like uncharacterized protein